MLEIICPHCKKAFKVDEAGYADIVKQVRDDKFDRGALKQQQGSKAPPKGLRSSPSSGG